MYLYFSEKTFIDKEDTIYPPIIYWIWLTSPRKVRSFYAFWFYGLPSAYDSVYRGKATETGVMANLVTPVKLTDKLVWYNSLNYFYWQVDNDENMPMDIQNPIQVHGFILRTGIYYRFDESRSLQVLLAPRLMTDFVQTDTDHLQWGGLAVYDKRDHDDLKIGFG